MVGCDSSTSGGGGGGDYEEFWRLTTELAAMVEGDVNTDTALDTTETGDFDGTALMAAGGPTMKIVENGEDASLWALEVTTVANWGEGIDLRHSEIAFKAGDRITITGKILNTFPAAPSSGDTWASPLLLYKTDIGNNNGNKTIINAPTAGASINQTFTLTQADVNDIASIAGENNAAGIRIGARPAGAQFRLDEILVERKTVAAATYTVTFFGTNKTTVLGTVSGVAKGATISAPTTEGWYTTFISTIPADKELKGWYVLNSGTGGGADTKWNFASSTVTSNISLYPVVEASSPSLEDIAVASFSAFSAEMDANQKYWIVNVDDLDNSDYFVFVTDGSLAGANKDGFGGLQVGWQKNSGSYTPSTGTKAVDWTDMTEREGVCYFFIKIVKLENYITTAGTDTNVRLVIGYWDTFAELGATGEAYLLNLGGFGAPDLVQEEIGVLIETKATPSVAFGTVLTEAEVQEGLGGGPEVLDYFSAWGGQEPDGSTPAQGGMAYWVVNVADLAKADYFVFVTDGTKTNANTGGIGGVKVGFQKNSGSYGMSNGESAPGWTSVNRSGICYIYIDLSELEDYTTTAGTDTTVRIYVQYFSGTDGKGFDELAATGEAALVKGITEPAGATSIDIGFVTTQELVALE
jgi:hypothetical protein